MSKERFVELVTKYNMVGTLLSSTDTDSINEAVESFFDGTFSDPYDAMKTWWSVEGVLTGEI